MKSVTLSLFLFLAFPMVANAVSQHYTPFPPNGTLYLHESACPGVCYPMLQGDGTLLDPEVVELKDGKLVVSPMKKAAKDAAQIAKNSADAAKKARLDALRAKIKGDVSAINSVAELKTLVLEMAEILGLRE